MKETGYFTDTDGNPSSKRVGAFMTLIIGLFLTVYMVIDSRVVSDIAILFSNLSGIALVLWGISKAGENQAKKIEKSNK